jgi:hypothetical protein
MHTETNQRLTEGNSTLPFERVTGFLDEALQLFAKGDSEQACRCLAEANSTLDSCLADKEPECGVTPISSASSIPSHSVEREESVLATIA